MHSGRKPRGSRAAKIVSGGSTDREGAFNAAQSIADRVHQSLLGRVRDQVQMISLSLVV